jgi:very-short-patch-repair endonuclease
MIDTIPACWRSTEVDARIMELAAGQHGAVGRDQLVASGVARHRIDHRVASGFLQPIHRGVYGVRSLDGPLRREFAGVLACGVDSFVSHRAAAAVHGVVPPLVATAPVSVGTGRDVRVRSQGLRVYRVGRLEPDEVTVHEGLPLTSPARTLLDLAGVTDSWELEGAVAAAFRTRIVDRATIEKLIARHPRHRGRGRLRAVLALEGGPAFTRSKAERLFLERVRRSGLPIPETNVFVEGFEGDCVWRRQRLIVEIDGREYHTGEYAVERDRHRDNALVAAGFRIMRVTWGQITREPDRLLVRVAQALVR